MCEHYLQDLENSGEYSDEYDSLDAADFFDDDESHDDGPTKGIERDIWKLVKNSDKAAGRALREVSRDESNLHQGIHVWHQIKSSLAATFSGWPNDSAEYRSFRDAVTEQLAVIKACQCEQSAAITDFLNKNPMVATKFRNFMAKSPYSSLKEKSRYHVAVLKIMTKGVKYVGEEARAKYMVELGPILKRGDSIFDTAKLHDKKKNSVSGSTTLTKNSAKKKRCIWVMTVAGEQDSRFYSHFGKLGRFHHSSFTGGSPVMAAGEWFVDKGVCTLINACSGHYQPPPWRFLRAFNELKRHGAISAQTEIQVWDRYNVTADGEYREPAEAFMNDLESNLRKYQLFPH